ncbi:hypothetical protein PR202_gb05824 [Eleusine coracana subsp. coracana]|uniref:PROP1-like PPR domain-containing protein n=1 Tax=Eleusine coracana subsp. coracana TaxID=191504 RepID=A0AAV5E5I3_ELECO|nr:hypothetical protein PR202_gb05824 [Eleusine coracana subsp. coracana]
MEVSSVPMLAASRFLPAPPPLAPPSCSRRNLPCVRAVPQTVEAPEAPNPPRSSPRRSAVAEVKASANPVAALTRFEDVLQTQDCNIILRHCGDARRWDDLSKVFEWMQEREMTNAASYSSYFKYLGLSRNPARVLQVRFDSSFKLYDEMIREGLTPDPFTYSTLLSGCMKFKQGYTKAMGLINELNSRGLQMDSVIYGTLLAICASHNYCEEAEVYFQKMKDEGHTPNLFHYSSLLNAYSENANHEKAELLMKDLRSSGLTPNEVILNTLLKVYSKGGLFEKAKELLSELEASGFAQDEMPYSILIDGLVKGGKIQEATMLFNEMKEKGVKSDGYAFSIMISALHRGGHRQESKQLAKEFEAENATYDLVLLQCKGLSPSIQNNRRYAYKGLSIERDGYAFSIMISALHRGGHRQESKQLAKEFEAENATYDLVMLNTSLRSYCSTNDMDSVMSLLKKMDDSNVSPDNITFNTLIRYSKRIVPKSLHEKALGILVSAGLLKDAYVIVKDNAELISPRSLEKFAKSFMASGNINLINDVMKALNHSGWRISQDIFGRAIERYIRKPDKKQLLLCLLDWMTGQGYSVDSSSRNLLLKNAHIFGQTQLIAEVLSKQQAASRTIGQRHKK